MCIGSFILRRVLTRCSGQLHTGWEQMTVIYLGMGELVRELRRQSPQPSSSRELQFQQFAGQVMEEVGLQRWVVQQGGIRMVVRQAHLLTCLLCPLHTKMFHCVSDES